METKTVEMAVGMTMNGWLERNEQKNWLMEKVSDAASLANQELVRIRSAVSKGTASDPSLSKLLLILSIKNTENYSHLGRLKSNIDAT